jgi:hypothetical protein
VDGLKNVGMESCIEHGTEIGRILENGLENREDVGTQCHELSCTSLVIWNYGRITHLFPSYIVLRVCLILCSRAWLVSSEAGCITLPSR